MNPIEAQSRPEAEYATLDAAETPAAEIIDPEDGETALPPDASPLARPPGLPDKFWDDAKGAVRTDALASSYLALEQKLGAMADNQAPDDPSDYRIVARDGTPSVDDEVNKRLHEAGFSQHQAQLVYDLAGEYLAPMVGEMAAEFTAQAEQDRLAQHFGGDDRWREISGQIREWGQANLAEDAYRGMAASVDGIKAMHRMMGADEPAMIRDGHAAGAPDSEDRLRALMRDPKYWRDHEPAIVERVRRGFERLYPDNV